MRCCEVLVDDHFRKLDAVQRLAVLLGEILIPRPHAAQRFVDGRLHSQLPANGCFPVVAAAPDALHHRTGKRLLLGPQLPDAVQHVVFQHD
jgi:hypothetical protein